MSTIVQPAYFLGLDVLGDPDQLGAAIFTGGALAEDAFLGLQAGTTQYGPCSGGGGAIAIIGALTGATEAAVQEAQAALTSLAGASGPLIVPTGLSVGGWDAWSSCSFTAGDLAWSTEGILAVSAWRYQVGYRLIFRRAGTLILCGSTSGPPLPPDWPTVTEPEGLPV